jgi:hypothetical protein
MRWRVWSFWETIWCCCLSMASIWSKTKLRRAEREEGFGGGSEEEDGEGWEVEKGFRREGRKWGLGF